MKKEEHPFFDTMRWVLLGGLVGLLIFLAHVLITHEPEDDIDNHANFSSGEQHP